MKTRINITSIIFFTVILFSFESAFSKKTIPNVLQISLSDGVKYNQIALRYTDKATISFDGEYDAYKLPKSGYKLSIYSTFKNKNGKAWKYAINSIPFNETKMGIPLMHKVAKDGKYKLLLTGIETFDKNTCIYIEDMEANIMIDPRKTNSYEFTDEKNVNYRNRFTVRTFAIPNPIITDESHGNDGEAVFSLNVKAASQLYTLDDKLLQSIPDTNEIAFSNLSKGTYKIIFTTNELSCASQTKEIKICGNNYDKLVILPESCGADGKVIISSKSNITAQLFSNSTNKLATSSDSIAFKKLTAGSYTLKIINNGSFCPTKIQEKAIEILPFNPMKISFSQRTDATCSLENGIIVANTKGGNAPYGYTWSNGTSSKTANNLKAGIYSVSVTDALGCKKKSNAISISNVVVKADFKITSSTTDTLRMVTLKNNSANADLFSWDFGDNELSTAKNPTEKGYADDGEYLVKLVVKSHNNCSDSLTEKVFFNTKNRVDNNLVYQKRNKIIIALDHSFEGTINCVSTSGKLLYSSTHTINSKSPIRIDMLNNANGLYIITLFDGEKVNSKKIAYIRN